MTNARRPENRNHISLLAGDEAARQAMLERMRGKLAGTSQDLAARAEGRRKSVSRKRNAWGWRVGLGALILAANAWLVIGHAEPALAAVKARKAPAVLAPTSLGTNDQALYWTYALYDFGRLQRRYGAPAHAVLDAAEAKRQLALLLPRVDAPTRFQIDRYLPRKGPKA